MTQSLTTLTRGFWNYI